MNQTKSISSNFTQINHWLDQASQDLKTAFKLIKIDPKWSLTISYQAMLKLGRALMFSFGKLPSGPAQHKTVVDFTSKKLGNKYKNLTNQFERLRRKRHDFLYGRLTGISSTEAKNAINSAKTLHSQIKTIITNRNPQTKLIK
ncbi:MAG: HEPN domain-containing protein [Candidatus Beckwithbacteria bacterium]